MMSMKKIWRKVIGSLLIIVLLLVTDSPAAEVVKVGSLNDVTGPTSDVGKDIALGMREAVAYVNDTRGINGKPIKLMLYDYGYRVPEAITTYKRFRDFDKVVAVWGWGTGDTEA
ncbi:MAG: ABC transporter substrate-binding protein, partial [candidate division NC10 bacterium]|nr:ABC transporter substrate-binding protein [candidate division NC10 bacterium]